MSKSNKKDNSKPERLIMVLDLLNRYTPRGGITLEELAERADVTVESIYRYFKVITNELKRSIVKKKGEGRKYKYSLEVGHLPSLSPETATALFLCSLQQQNTVFKDYLNDIKGSLISTLFKFNINPKQLAVETLQNRVYIVEESLAQPKHVGEIFNKIVGAIKNCHRLKFDYIKNERVTTPNRIIEPYGLMCKRQNWYLIGHDTVKDSLRVFRVDQIEYATSLSKEIFKYPADFNLKEYMSHNWGVMGDGDVSVVKLKVIGALAHRFRNMIYHHSQNIEEVLDDGSIIVSYKVRGLDEMMTWIVQWGEAMEVLEPAYLRGKLLQMGGKLVSLYSPKNFDTI